MRKTRRGKALEITPAVKKKVWERDEHLCILCGSPYAFPEAHYVSRGHGGKGVEENVVTLCRRCHGDFDFGDKETRQKCGEYIKNYLQKCYPDWYEEKLYYNKEID